MTTAGIQSGELSEAFLNLKAVQCNGSIIVVIAVSQWGKETLSVIKALGSIHIFFKGGHPVCCYFLGRTPIWVFFFSLIVTSEGGEIWTLVLTKETTECHWATRLLAGHPHVSLKNDDNNHNPFQFPLCLQSTAMSWLPHIIEQWKTLMKMKTN